MPFQPSVLRPFVWERALSDASVGLELRDQNGRVRVNLAVRSNGEPVLEFLSEDGKVLREFVSSSQ
jgi:hypothetical protein